MPSREERRRYLSMTELILIKASSWFTTSKPEIIVPENASIASRHVWFARASAEMSRRGSSDACCAAPQWCAPLRSLSLLDHHGLPEQYGCHYISSTRQVPTP